MTSLFGRPNGSVPAATFRSWLLALGVSAATALLIVSPFFWLGVASGHDFEFHAGSWLDVAGQWKEGIIYPRWSEWANHGFGEPRFIFYPPLSWMLGAGLSFVAPWNAVPVVFIVLAQTIAGLCAFALARWMLPERPALFGAACYAANPYALLIVYMRSDFAEQLAVAFFPLLVLAALQICGILESGGSPQHRAIGVFAMVFAAVWLSNAPAGVMASYSAALLFVWAAVMERSWLPLGQGSAGLALGFALAAFYLVPAAFEQRWVNIAQVLSSGLLPAQNFLYTTINDPEHNFFNWIASSAAVLMVVMTGIAAVAAHRWAESQDGAASGKKLWNTLLLLVAAVTILMIRVTSIFWNVLPELRFVQFPWRWAAVLAVPYAYFLSAAVARRRFAAIWVAAVLVASVGTAAFLVQHAWWDTEDIAVLQAAISRGDGFDGTDEYDPLGDDHYDLPAKAPQFQILSATASQERVPKALVNVEHWKAEEKVLRVTSREPARLALRLLNYPAWHVTVNGAPIALQRADEFNQMVVPVPTGESKICVQFIRTTDRSIGGILSLSSILALAGVYWTRRAKRS